MNKRYKIEGIHLLLKSILKQLPNNLLKQNSAQLNTYWRGCNPQPCMLWSEILPGKKALKYNVIVIHKSIPGVTIPPPPGHPLEFA
jgi:hypothetical protein